MNPKSINDLDPELKKTYDRVMGTSLAGNPTTPAVETQPVEQTPSTSAQAQPEASTSPPIENSTVSQVFRADNTTQSPETTTVNPPSSNAATAKTGGNKLLPIIIVSVVVFLAIYALIWAKVFGLF